MRVIDSANGAEERTKVCSQPEAPDLLGSLLEPCAGKLARTVLRGGWRSDAPSSPDIGFLDHAASFSSFSCSSPSTSSPFTNLAPALTNATSPAPVSFLHLPSAASINL